MGRLVRFFIWLWFLPARRTCFRNWLRKVKSLFADIFLPLSVSFLVDWISIDCMILKPDVDSTANLSSWSRMLGRPDTGLSIKCSLVNLADWKCSLLQTRSAVNLLNGIMYKMLILWICRSGTTSPPPRGFFIINRKCMGFYQRLKKERKGKSFSLPNKLFSCSQSSSRKLWNGLPGKRSLHPDCIKEKRGTWEPSWLDCCLNKSIDANHRQPRRTMWDSGIIYRLKATDIGVIKIKSILSLFYGSLSCPAH